MGKRPKTYREAYAQGGWSGVVRFHFDLRTARHGERVRAANVALVALALGGGVGALVAKATGQSTDTGASTGAFVGAVLLVPWLGAITWISLRRQVHRRRSRGRDDG